MVSFASAATYRPEGTGQIAGLAQKLERGRIYLASLMLGIYPHVAAVFR
jgi:hypothetical protein